MGILSLAIKSFRNRRFATGLAITSIMLSVALLLGVEILRDEAKNSFTSTISGTDLIVGARTSPTHLLLFSVFGIGNPNNNLDWSSYNALRRHAQVKWSIPITMGDSHRGFRVIGTDGNYFEHYRYARDQRLSLRQGAWFAHDDETVLGAEAAKRLGYALGDKIVVAHGAGDESFIKHDQRPFHVSGILERTGTPVDSTVFVSLSGFDALHHEPHFGGGMRARTYNPDQEPASAHKHEGADSDEHVGGDEHAHDDEHVDEAKHAHGDEHDDEAEHAHGDEHADENINIDRKISGFLLGLHSRTAALFMLREINEYEAEPLSAIMPGFTLLELWEIVGLVENTLIAISAFVVVVGLFSMLIILMTSMNERRREMAILRSLGARPLHVFLLILGEAAFVTLAGILLGGALVSGLILVSQDWVAGEFGLFIALAWLTPNQLIIVSLVAVLGCLVGIIPGIRIYRYSLSDGMTVRV